MSTCPRCQAAIPSGSRFCIACGVALAAPAPSVVQPGALAVDRAGQGAAVVVQPAARNKGTALAIEAVAAIFGIFGVGWLYSGNTAIGIIFLIAGFCWDALVFVLSLVSLGVGLLCLVPIHLALVVVSVLLLNIAMPKDAP